MMTFLSLEGLQADPEIRDLNNQRFGQSDKHVDQCFLCGRGLTEKAKDNGWMIHLHTSGVLISNDYLVDDLGNNGSQGCFPVGSECAKRVPATFRFKF